MDLPEFIVGKRVDPLIETPGSPQPDNHNPDGHTNPAQAPTIVRDLSQLAAMRKLFSTIYADPPWPYSNTASRATAENYYRTMTLNALRNEPVKSVVAGFAALLNRSVPDFFWNSMVVKNSRIRNGPSTAIRWNADFSETESHAL